jgi:hypothetical protein
MSDHPMPGLPQHAEEPSVRVTLSEMYRLLQTVDRKVDTVATGHSQITTALGEHNGRLNAHSDSIHSQGERIGKLETEIAAVKADRTPKAPVSAWVAIGLTAMALVVSIVTVAIVTARP